MNATNHPASGLSRSPCLPPPSRAEPPLPSVSTPLCRGRSAGRGHGFSMPRVRDGMPSRSASIMRRGRRSPMDTRSFSKAEDRRRRSARDQRSAISDQRVSRSPGEEEAQASIVRSRISVLPLEEALSGLYRRLADETTVIPRAITTAAGHRASRAAFLSREFIVRAPSSPRVRMRASFRTPRNNRSFNSDAGGSSLSPSRIIRAHNARLLVIAHAFRRERLYLPHVVSRAGFIIAAAMICRIATSPLPPSPLSPRAPPLLGGAEARRASRGRRRRFIKCTN